jgi:hypothetical protein
MTNEELIKDFHEKVTSQVHKEYVKNGFIQTKIILLCLDAKNNPIYTIKKVPDILNKSGDDFLKHFLNVEKKITKFVDSVKSHGFEVLSLYHVEYVYDDGDGSEGYFSSIKTGDDFRNVDIFHYRINNSFSMVLPDGTIERTSPTFELIENNWNG